VVAIAMSIAAPVSAQSSSEDTPPVASESAVTSVAPETEAEDGVTTTAASTAPDEFSDEPLPETPPGYVAHAVPTPPPRSEGGTPRPTVVPAPQDAERASAAVTAPPHEPDVELAITVNGLLNFGGTTTPVLVANADLVFALDPHVWFGIGIAFSYAEQHTIASPGIPDMKFVTTSVSVPLIFQYYFDTPRVGAAIPTLRVLATPGWSESPVGAPTPSTQVVTGTAAILAGVTWMATSWLALRIIGGVNGGFGVNVVGPINITGNVGVQALISLVTRF
jgi:hypothetical protein